MEVDSEYTMEVGMKVKIGFYHVGDKESLKIITRGNDKIVFVR